MKKYIALLACLALSACSTMEISEKSVIRPDERPPAAAGLGSGYTLEHLEFRQADGAVSRGIRLSNPQSVATVLYLGGSEFRIDKASRRVIESLAKASVDIVMFDYRGYGRSDGEPTVELLKSDAVGLYRYMKMGSRNKVILYGLSMGSFIAAAAAQVQPPDGLILEGAATNVKDLVSSFVPWYAKPFVTVKIAPTLADIDNVRALKSYTGPLLVLGGQNDSVVPITLQKKLWENAATQQKTLHLIPGHDHQGLIESEEFQRALKRFLVNKVKV